MKFNKSVAKAVAAAVVSVLLALGVSYSKEIGAVLEALTAFVPESAPPAVAPADAGPADAGL